MPNVESTTAAASNFVDVTSDLEKLIARRLAAEFAAVPRTQPEKIPAKVYGVMALTTALTFATLMTGHQLLFPPHQMFASAAIDCAALGPNVHECSQLRA